MKTMGMVDRIPADTQGAEECVNDTWFHAWNSMPPQNNFENRSIKSLPFSHNNSCIQKLLF